VSAVNSIGDRSVSRNKELTAFKLLSLQHCKYPNSASWLSLGFHLSRTISELDTLEVLMPTNRNIDLALASQAHYSYYLG